MKLVRKTGLAALLWALTSLMVSQVFAAESVRWTGQDDANAAFSHILDRLNSEIPYELTEVDFKLGEDRDLAFTHYRRYDQRLLGVPIDGRSIRIWTDRNSGQLVQVEAVVENPKMLPRGVLEQDWPGLTLTDTKTMKLVRDLVGRHEDSAILNIDYRDTWYEKAYVRIVTVKSKRGEHRIILDQVSAQVVGTKYIPYPQQGGQGSDEFAIPARVYPVYEEYQGARLERQDAELKYIKATIPKPGSDPYAPVKGRRYFYSKHNPTKAETPQGRADGYWSITQLQKQIYDLEQALPVAGNTFTDGDVLLYGRYATINIHPDALKQAGDLDFQPGYSALAMYGFTRAQDRNDWELKITTAYTGKPLTSYESALQRPAIRDPKHDLTTYINAGFDEVQVYYAINQLFDALRPMGFVDPDLADRPFDAILYDPDIAMRDNAFYHDDTINFTTYSPNAPNYARDNTTIWHELGHGVMDRLMGKNLELADTGGLSEGMADFVAELVIYAVVSDQNYPGANDRRIINKIGFHLTNEVHDDGEAYGGTMKVILDRAMATFGSHEGLRKIADLVLEAMRLCRDNPALTASAWFDHMLFADQLGRPGVRASGELSDIINEALASRNFAAPESRAVFSVRYGDAEVSAGAAGSRDNEIPVSLTRDASKAFDLKVKLVDGDSYKFHYPVKLKVLFSDGPLEGAVDWVDEDLGPKIFTISQSGDEVQVPLAINGVCDEINRADGSCSDYVYLQVWNEGDNAPAAKKRFYVRLKTAN